MRFSTEEFYVKSPEEMAAAFHYAPDALANTAVIAERCNLELDFKTYHFPCYTPAGGESLEECLAEESHAGLDSRLAAIRELPAGIYGSRCRGLPRAVAHRARLHHADGVSPAISSSSPISSTGPRITASRSGPGRGSAAGSLVAYALRITDLDPIPYNLLFERFLNPERISMPDIDVDFCQDRREEVIQYVADKYGRDKVCQIITFGTMAARGVIRDVGRALDLPYGDVDKIAKLIPEVLGITLKQATVAGAEAERDGGRRSAGERASRHRPPSRRT